MTYIRYTDVTQEGVPVDFRITVDEAVNRQKELTKKSGKVYSYDKEALEDFLYYNFGWIEK